MSTNNRWTAQHIPDVSGKIAIVTGANSGIGYETSRALAGKGAQVIMACRSVTKGQAALDQIRGEFPNSAVELMPLDLADLASVRQFVDEFTRRFDQLHILCNNAGIMMLPKRYTTADGFEMQFGTNHLGHFALTGLLLETLLNTKGARVVTVSSFAHYMGWINFNDLNAEKSYNRNIAYCQSKLANLLFTYELQRRFAASGADVIAAAAHPGWTATNLQTHSGFFRTLNPFIGQTPEMGALPTLYAATAPDVRGGDYYGPRLIELRGYPKRTGSTRRSHNEVTAAKLWAVSEELTGVIYPAFSRQPRGR